MPGYHNDPKKNAEVFDEEGYYRTGDMVVFHDDGDPAQGLAFAGRMAEEFKLSNGTWVYGGQLREKLLKTLSDATSKFVTEVRPAKGQRARPHNRKRRQRLASRAARRSPVSRARWPRLRSPSAR